MEWGLASFPPDRSSFLHFLRPGWLDCWLAAAKGTKAVTSQDVPSFNGFLMSQLKNSPFHTLISTYIVILADFPFLAIKFKVQEYGYKWSLGSA